MFPNCTFLLFSPFLYINCCILTISEEGQRWTLPKARSNTMWFKTGIFRSCIFKSQWLIKRVHGLTFGIFTSSNMSNSGTKNFISNIDIPVGQRTAASIRNNLWRKRDHKSPFKKKKKKQRNATGYTIELLNCKATINQKNQWLKRKCC